MVIEAESLPITLGKSDSARPALERDVSISTELSSPFDFMDLLVQVSVLSSDLFIF